MDNRSEHIYGNLKVVQNNRYLWGVEDLDGNIIVPYGKYEWIDGFDHGLARVRTVGRTTYTKNISALCSLEGDEIITDEEEILAKVLEDREKRPEVFAKWGIINEKGEEVLPVEYDEIWKFLGKNRDSTKVVKDGVEREVYFYDLNHKLPFPGQRSKSKISYNSNYSRYDMKRDAWSAMTDGMYGDYPGYVDDYDFLGF